MLTLRDILRPGITGKIGWRDKGGKTVHIEPIGDEHLKAFRAACHTAARRLHAKVLSEEPDAEGRNYNTITLALPREHRSLELMLHSVLPYIGARVRTSDDSDPLYTDCPFVPDECAPLLIITPSFTILPASLLKAPIPPSTPPEPWMQPLIDPAAWDDLHYFKPRRIGDFVFNNYD